MTALAARSLGYRVHVLDPDPQCPARGLCDRFVEGALADPKAARELGSGADVVTFDREDMGGPSLAALESLTALYPGQDVLQRVQDRGVQKNWLARNGFPVGPYYLADDLAGLGEALAQLGADARLKSRKGGFDGRSQWSAKGLSAQELWAQAGGVPLSVEQNLRLRAELSVMVARGVDGDISTFPVAYNIHERGALEVSVMPAPLPPRLIQKALWVAHGVAERLGVVGLLAVEFFWTECGQLLINELAARPHNTFHTTEWACVTSQFEQLVRAICGLPLGSTAVLKPAAITNLFGDLWLAGREQALVEMLRDPSVHLRLYDKAPRPHRKLGHLVYVSETPEQALAGAQALRGKLNAAIASPQAVPLGLVV